MGLSAPESSYRSIVRSTGIIAGSQFGVLLIGLVRAKLFGMWLGPVGIGLLGILNSLLSNAALVAGMGLGTSAVQRIADPQDDVTVVQRAVLWLAVLLGALGGTATFLMREQLSLAVNGDRSLASAIGWLGLAVALSVFASGLIAVLQGLRRLGDLARLQLGGTLIGVAIGVAAVAFLGLSGIIVATVAAPAGLVIAGLLLLRRQRHSGRPRALDARRVAKQWTPILRVGAVVMASTLIAACTQTLLRSLVLRELGLEQLGLFQAAISIMTMNVTIVLTAMAADYFPRLSQVADHREATQQLLNEQLHVAVLASLPILAVLSAGANLWLLVLFSSQFTPAAELMRWLAVGEAIRLPLWALGYVLLARRDTLAYVSHELAFTIVSVPTLYLAVKALGIEGTGIGFVSGYAASLVITLLMVRGRHGISLGIRSLLWWLLLVSVTAGLLLLGRAAPAAATAIGFPLALLLGILSLRQLDQEGALPHALARLLPKRIRGSARRESNA